MLALRFSENYVEAGCDEAGRGCLAGPMFAAAVILPADFRNELLDDSKKLTHQQREELRPIIEREALAWEVASVDNLVIDEINILRASFRAMHLAIAQLQVKPELLLIDGNRFDPYPDIPHHGIIRGDGQYMSIAAASVLAKTHRDAFMCSLHDEYPFYNWKQNKGYPTSAHREAIMIHGITPLHRRSFNMHTQLDMDF